MLQCGLLRSLKIYVDGLGVARLGEKIGKKRKKKKENKKKKFDAPMVALIDVGVALMVPHLR